MGVSAAIHAAEGPPVGIVSHVKVLSDKVEDVSSLDAWRRSFIRDGMTDRDKALAAWESVVRFQHQDSPPVEFLQLENAVLDAIKMFNVYGYSMCGNAASHVQSLARAAGLEARGWTIQAHVVPEVSWGGKWRQAALRRHLIHSCTEIARDCYDGTVDTDALLDKAQAEIFSATQGDRAGEATAVRDILQGIFTDIESMRENRITGLRTWFNDMDDLTCGLQRSELIIVAGRPSMGKTTLALNIAMRVALGGWPRPNKPDAKPALIFSLEMSKPVIARNILCGYARVDAHRLRRGLLPREEINALTMKAGDLYEAPIYIDDTPGLSLRDLRTRARRLKMTVPDLALVVVDYLQLMEERNAENRQQEISIISRGLKGLARELNLPVIAISQLSRATEAREGHIPRMSDLRESGSLEQDADLIILLYREEHYNPGARPGEADLIVAKQRNGPTGTVTTTFLKNYLRFEDRSHQEQTPF